jgi:uncharacterized OB-fold protein
MSVGFPAKIWREAKKDYQTIGKEGRLLYWTTVKKAGEGFEKMVPYQVALIRLEKKKVIGGQLVDCLEGNLKKGMRLVSVPRRVRANGPEEPIKYGIKWRPK